VLCRFWQGQRKQVSDGDVHWCMLPGEYDWTAQVRQRRGLMSNYFDQLLHNVVFVWDEAETCWPLYSVIQIMLLRHKVVLSGPSFSTLYNLVLHFPILYVQLTRHKLVQIVDVSSHILILCWVYVWLQWLFFWVNVLFKPKLLHDK